MRSRFTSQFGDMKKKVVTMGELVGKAIESSVESLKSRNMAIAEWVIDNDQAVDAMEREIEQLCTHIVATQQPFASDLRKVVSGYKIIACLERMGDLAADLAQVSLRIGPVPLIKPLVDVPKMAELVRQMLQITLGAYINESLEEARRLLEMDREIDSYYSLILEELNNLMSKDASAAHQGTQLLLAARFLERMGDYCTNIGEEVIYISLGIRENLND